MLAQSITVEIRYHDLPILPTSAVSSQPQILQMPYIKLPFPFSSSSGIVNLSDSLASVQAVCFLKMHRCSFLFLIMQPIHRHLP